MTDPSEENFPKKVSRSDFFRESWNSFLKTIDEFFGDSLENAANTLERWFPEILLPPGARTEEEFLHRCNRCGACLKACPFFVLRRVLRPGTFVDGLPSIEPAQAFCRFCEDFPCIQACPTGALTRTSGVTPPPIGLAEVNPSRCLRPQKTTCEACYKACPERFHALILPDAPELPPQVSANNCTGCGACAAACPVRPETAISVRRRS